MNDNTINPQEKIGTAIDSGELKDEELENVHGGAVDIFLHLSNGIKGGSMNKLDKAPKHGKWIDVLSSMDKSSPYL